MTTIDKTENETETNMNTNDTTRNTTASAASTIGMSRAGGNMIGGLGTLLALTMAASLVGCAGDFDPPSLIEKPRVVGAHVEVAGAPDRATPQPGETATVTWLVTAPGTMPPMGWAFAVCAPGAAATLDCAGAPLAVFQGSDNPPRFSMTVPAADALGGARSLSVYGRLCANSTPTFDPQSGYPGCSDGGDGTTTSVTIRLQIDASTADAANHNPTAERAFSFDGAPWAMSTSAPGTDPCVAGPRVTVGTEEHVIALTTAGTDRESYTAMRGDPPVATVLREALQVSQFTTRGKLTSPYSFVESDDTAAEPVVDMKWKTPVAKDVTAETAVTFTFVVRDGRGGTDWTTRTACVVPQ